MITCPYPDGRLAGASAGRPAARRAANLARTGGSPW